MSDRSRQGLSPKPQQVFNGDCLNPSVLGTASDALGLFGVVPDVNAFDQEDHVFGDVRRVVADPLQVAGYEYQIDRRRHDAGIALHGFLEFGVHRIAKSIHFIVRKKYRTGQDVVSIHKRVQALEQHGLDQGGHLWDIDHRLDQRMMHQGERTLRHVLGEIADALQVGVDLESGGQKAEIASHGLEKSEQPGYHAVDFHLHPVDSRLVANDLLSEFPALIDEGADAAAYSRLHQPTHFHPP